MLDDVLFCVKEANFLGKQPSLHYVVLRVSDVFDKVRVFHDTTDFRHFKYYRHSPTFAFKILQVCHTTCNQQILQMQYQWHLWWPWAPGTRLYFGTGVCFFLDQRAKIQPGRKVLSPSFLVHIPCFITLHLNTNQ